jgi:hypothetical protein
MTDTAWETRPLYAAIVTRLASETGKAIGKAQAPGSTTPPYAFVSPVAGSAETSLSDSHMTADQLFQVTSVGDDLDEAQWMQFEVRQALLGWTPGVAGATRIQMDQPDLSLGTDLEGPVTAVADRYSISLS